MSRDYRTRTLPLYSSIYSYEVQALVELVSVSCLCPSHSSALLTFSAFGLSSTLACLGTLPWPPSPLPNREPSRGTALVRISFSCDDPWRSSLCLLQLRPVPLLPYLYLFFSVMMATTKAEPLPLPSRNPLPLSAAQEAQVRDLYHKRVRGQCANEIRGDDSTSVMQGSGIDFAATVQISHPVL